MESFLGGKKDMNVCFYLSACMASINLTVFECILGIALCITQQSGGKCSSDA